MMTLRRVPAGMFRNMLSVLTFQPSITSPPLVRPWWRHLRTVFTPMPRDSRACWIAMMTWLTHWKQARKYCYFKLPWASCQIRKIAGSACAGNAGNVSPHRRLQRKPLVSDPGIHHGTCVTHVPWFMSGSLIRSGGGNVPGIPGACATRNFTYRARGPWWRHGMETLSALLAPHKWPSIVDVLLFFVSAWTSYWTYS